MKLELTTIRIYTNMIKVSERLLVLAGIDSKKVLKFLKPFNQIRHNMIDRVIRRDASDIIVNIEGEKGHTNAAKVLDLKSNNFNPVWVMWWQNEIPPIVQLNIKRMRNLFGDRLIVISKDNFLEYLTVDSEMLELINSNSMNLTTFSDYIRTGLLFNYGGLWVDSTVYMTDAYSDDIFMKGKDFFTSYGEWWYSNKFVPSGRWTGFFMGGIKNELYFKLVNEIMRYYLLNEKKKPDYFVVDYALNIAYEDNIGQFREKVDQLSPINQNVLQLSKVMNCKYNEMEWKQIQKNSFAFKLTYKKKYLSKIDGESTFYDYLYGNSLSSERGTK